MKPIALAREIFRRPSLLLPEAHAELAHIFEKQWSRPGAPAAAGKSDADATWDQSDAPSWGKTRAEMGGGQSGSGPRLLQVVDGVGIVSVSGVLGKNLDECQQWFGGVDVLDVQEALQAGIDNGAVSSFVLHVDSPGGSVAGIPDLGDFVAAVSREKPVIAFADGMMASAGYWISAGADAIYATQEAEVGSIGVYLPFVDRVKEFAEMGRTVELFKTGRFKGAGYPGTALTDDQRAQFQKEVDLIFNLFQTFVTSFRKGVGAEQMQGQVFIGEEARGVGLVDSVTTFDKAVIDARERGRKRW